MSVEEVLRSARTVDPTTFVVGEEMEHVGTILRPTLMSIATKYCRITLSDLRALNPELDQLPANKLIPLRTRVRLPTVTPDQRDYPAAPGGRYALREAEARLLECDARLDALVADAERGPGPGLPPLPPRGVLSQTEALREAVGVEARRQLAVVRREFGDAVPDDDKLACLVDPAALRKSAAEVEQQFSGARVSLTSFQAARVEEMGDSVAKSMVLLENVLCTPDVQPTADLAADTCPRHTHRWEVAVCKASTTLVSEEWAFISCQPLTTFIDAMLASCVASKANGYPLSTSKDSVLLISDVFYIDDRHTDHKDISEAIRHFSMPLGHGSGSCAGGAGAYHRCPVRSASTTCWGDLALRQDEYCTLRHLGGCDHYFYLKGPRALPQGTPGTRLLRALYPHRLAAKKEATLVCQFCRLYPATVAVYGDPDSPTNPAVYCPVCDHLVHSGSSGEPGTRPYLRVTPGGDAAYFASQV